MFTSLCLMDMLAQVFHIIYAHFKIQISKNIIIMNLHIK